MKHTMFRKIMRKSYYLWVVHIPIPLCNSDIKMGVNYAPHTFCNKALAKQFLSMNKNNPELKGAVIIKYKKEIQ